jgi:hypothetical protein
MKIGPVRLFDPSLILLAVQLALVSSIAVKYLYQRVNCPRAWTKTVAIDPDAPMRGRYLSLQLIVDGCQSTLPSAKQAAFRRNIDGTTNRLPYSIAGAQLVLFPASLSVKDGRLFAVRIPNNENPSRGQLVSAFPKQACDEMRLVNRANFYIPEKAASPLPVKPGTELWIEVTVPPGGPPRPIQLALKQDNAWKPLLSQ